MRLPDLSGGALAQVCARIGSALATAIAISFALAIAPDLKADDENAIEDAFDSIISKTALRHSMDPLLVKAVIWNESRFRPRVTGASGEMGLMQVKWAAVRDWANASGRPMPTREQVYDPYFNIEIGTWFLARAMERWDGKSQCYTLALCEYNAGPSRAVVWKSRTAQGSDIVIGSSKTRRYVANVRDKYIEYCAESAGASSVAGSLPAGVLRQPIRTLQPQ